MKKQTDLSFKEAKNEAVNSLSALARFMEDMNDKFSKQVPLDWVVMLRTLELKVSQASNACLNQFDIIQLIVLAQQLIQANPDIADNSKSFGSYTLKFLQLLNLIQRLVVMLLKGLFGLIGFEWKKPIYFHGTWYLKLKIIRLHSLFQ